MRLWLLLLLLHVAHWTDAAIFKNCDAKDTICYSLPICKGEAGDGLVLVSANQVNAEADKCGSGFELGFADDHSWSLSFALEGKRSVERLRLVAKNGQTETMMADSAKDLKEDLYNSIRQGDAPRLTATITSEEFNRIKDALADVFHLSYGQSVICMNAEFNDGEKASYCTEPIKFDVFNTDCQTKNWIDTDSGCHADHKLCEPATELDNVFTCPDKEKNTIFLSKELVGIGKTVRCTKEGWRTNEVAARSTGKFLMKKRVAPQCVSLCDEHFLRSTETVDEDSQPTIVSGVMTCKITNQAPMIDDKFLIGGQVTCAESQWKQSDGKIIETNKGYISVVCKNLYYQFVKNDCAPALQTTPETCASFNEQVLENGMLMCADAAEQQIIYKGQVYGSMRYNADKLVWEGNGKPIGPAEEVVNPYCVYMCSHIFVNLDCDGSSSCAKAKYTGGRVDGESYMATLECSDPDSVLIMNSDTQFGPRIECDKGTWKDETNSATALSKVKASDKKALNVQCHPSCHESLVANDCQGEAGCTSAKMLADKTVTCEDGGFVIEASADVMRTRKTHPEKIFDKKRFKKLQCTKEGWIADDNNVIDFKKYPQNDISVNCKSKCSQKFVSCWKQGAICPKTLTATEVKCADDQIAWLEDQPSMDDLVCDPKKGWHEVKSKKLIIDFSTVDFTKKGFKDFLAVCTDSCTDKSIDVDCAGDDNGCVKPKLADKKLTCPGNGRVMRVNDHIELHHLMCSREAWTGSNPAELTIPRKAHDEKIKVACLSKCDHSFIKASECVEKTTCDTFKITNNELTCSSPKDFIVANSHISSSPFSCDPVNGWTNKEGETAGDFSKNELKVDAHCFRNCDVSRIKDACNGEKGCAKFTYTNDVLSCPAGHVLSVNDKDLFTDVQCEAEGFKSGADFLLKFSVANKKEQLSVKCISKCNAKYVSLTCTEQPCIEPTLSGTKLKCADKSDLLILGSTPVYSSSLHCDPLNGWLDGTTVVHDLTGDSVHITATCRQFCNNDMVHVELPELLIPYVKGRPLQCRDLKNYRLFLNDADTGDVTCEARGWKSDNDDFAVKFDEKTTGSVSVECRHKCDPRFIKQACAGEPTCTDAIYTDKKLSCAHPSELLIIDDKESLTPLVCSNDGWSEGANLMVDKKTIKNYAVQAQCLQLCHPDFVTLKDGAAPFTYSLGAQLTCPNDSEMLIAQDAPTYSDLSCDRDGWRNAKKELVVQFHGVNHARTITAGCTTNDCLSRGFAPPCGDDKKMGTCLTPNHTAYTLFCEKPLSLVASIYSMIHYTDVHCRDGHWLDDSNRVITEGDETPMRFQCFGKECVKCLDSLGTTCTSLDLNCLTRRHVQGAKTYCSRYECETSWWRVTEGDKARYYKGALTCHDDGIDYRDDNGYIVSGAVDCVRQAPCSSVSPLDMKCDGLAVVCVENPIAMNAMGQENGKCPEPNKFYHKTDSNEWEEFSSLKCDKNGQWSIEREGETRVIEKGSRVVCTADHPSIGLTTPPPTTTTADPSKPCDGCRASLHVSQCDDCASLTDGMLTFDEDGKSVECVAKSSTNVIEIGGGNRAYEELHCKLENGKYIWRTADGDEVAQFAAHRSSPPWFAQAGSTLGYVTAACVLILLGIAGSAVLVVFYRKREEQKRVAGLTKGLEQKNDDIFDAISVESVKTLKI